MAESASGHPVLRNSPSPIPARLGSGPGRPLISGPWRVPKSLPRDLLLFVRRRIIIMSEMDSTRSIYA